MTVEKFWDMYDLKDRYDDNGVLYQVDLIRKIDGATILENVSLRPAEGTEQQVQPNNKFNRTARTSRERRKHEQQNFFIHRNPRWGLRRRRRETNTGRY